MITIMFLTFIILLVLYIKLKKNLHMLQQNLYNENNRYLKWIVKNKKIFFEWDLVSVVLLGLDALFFTDKVGLFQIILFFSGLFYVFFMVFSLKSLSKEQAKLPFVLTSRIKRLLVTIFFFYAILLTALGRFIFTSKESAYALFFVALSVYLNPFLVLLANTINKYTVEKYVYNSFKKKAMKKLSDMPYLKVIGITGSYGKTSSKMILNEILKSKYLTRPTPKNLNTPYGLIITINNYLDKFDEVFLAEMGAYRRGEIQQLCDLVHPKYGILTTIGTAHLESFGSEENIQKTKFELIESLPSDGIGILNRDDPKQVQYPLKNTCRIQWIGIDSSDASVRASHICYSSEGTDFDVTFEKDKKKYHFQTKLLGKHNIYNILGGIALGRELGISIEQLIQAVKRITPVEHRLELKKIGRFYQIDDAYNSNPVGAKAACEVLKMMDGLKIVVTPGMVELGSQEEKYNSQFGEEIASVADYVVLIGKKQTRPIYEGLKKAKFDMENVIIYNDVREAYTFINGLKTKKKIYALFENDLPDTYNE